MRNDTIFSPRPAHLCGDTPTLRKDNLSTLPLTCENNEEGHTFSPFLNRGNYGKGQLEWSSLNRENDNEQDTCLGPSLILPTSNLGTSSLNYEHNEHLVKGKNLLRSHHLEHN